MIEQHTNGALVTDLEGDLVLASARLLAILCDNKCQAPGPYRDAIRKLHATLNRLERPNVEATL